MTSCRTSAGPLRIVVSIINFRTPDLTIQCVESVLADLGELHAHVVIVDNFSADGSVRKISRWIRELGPTAPVTLLKSEINSGFSAGHNKAILSFPADYYLILNSDTLLQRGFFDAIVAAIQNNPNAGLYAPRVDYTGGQPQHTCFRFPNPISEIIRGAHTGLITRTFKKYDVILNWPPPRNQIDWANFSCVLICHKLLNDLGPMDEGYFLYFEDTAYCWKMRQAGWEIDYVPEARLVHFEGGSGPVESSIQNYERLPTYYYASRTRFFYQAYGLKGLVLANTCWYLGRLLAGSRILLGHPIPKTNATEWRDIWTNTLKPLDVDTCRRNLE
ncbi:MAG: glycosyltransferase family 2 protein [Hyphomicrobiales bacterium]